MPLQPGTRLGNYEVLSELGSGEMGEVTSLRYSVRDHPRFQELLRRMNLTE